MHRILVEEKRWISEARFLHALNYCMLLPGPEAQQLATYIGWLMHRTLGGIMAGVLFVLPGVVAIMALSYVYAGWGNVPIVVALFFGLKAAVLAIVIEAVVRIGKRSLRTGRCIALAGGRLCRHLLSERAVPDHHLWRGADRLCRRCDGACGIPRRRRTWTGQDERRCGRRQSARRAIAGACAPHRRPRLEERSRMAGAVADPRGRSALATLGSSNVFSEIAVFFSKMAMVTFGGAYAVLAYVAQQAVEHYGWLKPGEMLDGLGMAETTPGPLIMVLQFVGFMAAFRDPGGLSPMVAGTLGGLLATWVTFTPCFLWIFLGAPFVEKLRGNKALNAALSAITAAVVGVILNLAIWFAIHCVFRKTIQVRAFPLAFDAPSSPSVDGWALALSVAAAVAIFRFKVGMIQTLAACCAAGVLLYLAGVIAEPTSSR